MTPDEQRLLEFVAEHPFVLVTHVMELLGVDEREARELTGALAGRGWLRRDRVFAGGVDWFRITSRGLTEIGSELAAPVVDWRSWRHDAGVVWIWLGGMKGVFGELVEVVSERRMRARDRLRMPRFRSTMRAEAMVRAATGSRFGLSAGSVQCVIRR